MFHFSGILFVIVYYTDMLHSFPGEYFLENTRSILFYALFLTFAFMVIFEFLRFRYVFFQNLFIKVAGKILKPYEVEKMHGSMPFFLGLAICTGFFMKEVALLSSIFLMVGDPCAAWFGGRYGKHKLYNGKSYEGLIAGVLGAFSAGVIFLLLNMFLEPDNIYSELMRSNPVMLLATLMVGSISAFIVELFSSTGFLDDNILIPVVSGLIMSFCLMVILQINQNQVFYNLNDLILPK